MQNFIKKNCVLHIGSELICKFYYHFTACTWTISSMLTMFDLKLYRKWEKERRIKEERKKGF